MSKRKEAHAQKVLDRIARHDQLVEAHVRFEAEHGRSPTARELWDLCPPEK